MEKIGPLLWILFAIGAFVFRMIQKARETGSRENQERPVRPGGAVPGLPAASFQELLQQMQARNAAPSAAPGPPLAPAAPQPVAERTLGGRRMPSELGRPARSQERSTVRRPSLEATARGRHTPTPLARRSSALPRASAEAPLAGNRPTAASASAPLNETVRQMLRQPESVRAALVLSEILQRKY